MNIERYRLLSISKQLLTKMSKLIAFFTITITIIFPSQHSLSSAVCPLKFAVQLQQDEDQLSLQLGIATAATRCTLSLDGLESEITSAFSRIASRTGVRPIVHVSTCPHLLGLKTANISHTLIAVAADAVERGCSSTTINDCRTPEWGLSLPTYYSTNTRCIDVFVEASSVGPGPHIDEIRMKLYLQTSTPLQTSVDTVDTCSGMEEESPCEVLGVSSYEQVVGVALVRRGPKFYIEYPTPGHGGGWSLPDCVKNGGIEVPRWILLENATCEETYTSFTPSEIHIVSPNELYIMGDGLLFSPNRGITIYQLLLPSFVETVSSFASSRDRKFAFFAISNETIEIWLGYIGSVEILKIYPSAILQNVWASSEASSCSRPTVNTTLRFDTGNNLHLVCGSNSSLKLPLSLLLHNAIYIRRFALGGNLSDSAFAHHQAVNNYTHQFLDSSPHELFTAAAGYGCPFVKVKIDAPKCDAITRSKLHVVKEGILKWISEDSLPEKNCDVFGNDLPADIFLRQSESYHFTAHFTIDPRKTNPNSLHIVAKVSDPNMLGVELGKSFHSINNTIIYRVTIYEKHQLQEQFQSGFIISSVSVEFQAWEANAACIDPFTEHSTSQGHLQTRVHVGCPPGLSLVFDTERSGAEYNHYCKQADDVSCYYFNHEFHPVFQVIDSVTEEQSTYTGRYTLRALAGGTRINNMKPFDESKNIESSIWTPINSSKEDDNTYSYSDNGIKWVCGTASPCGEIIPHSGKTPEYYLLLEASNVIHGMGMGSVTTVVTVLLLISVLGMITLCTFGMWHFRLRLQYWRDLAMESCMKRLDGTKQRILELIRRHRAAV